MVKSRIRSDISSGALKKQALQTVILVFGLVAVSALIIIFISWQNRLGNEKRELQRYWEEGAYKEAYEKSRERLQDKPLDYFFLQLHGFVSYQLAVAQINNFDTLTYIDDCIWSLRKALLSKDADTDGQLQYVLGKAYYLKGPPYADLAIKYLEEARGLSYNARDISEYLGLSYVVVHDYRNSVEALTQALKPGSGGDYVSDLLLMAIAQSYIGLEDSDSARAYLVRCIEQSRDTDVVRKARLLLGKVLTKSGDTAEAEKVFNLILENDPENVEALYELGELYTAMGERIRARAVRRRAFNIDPTYGPVRERLNM
jgi:tetratricopeptide (TPR) repeat protein